MTMRFKSRTEAGQMLADRLSSYAGQPDLLVLGLPRGGVPVAFEVARALNAPLDVLLVRKLGVPGYEELAMGAIASNGVRVLNEDVVRELSISGEAIQRTAAREQRELERREREYRGDRPQPEIEGRTVILIDDGLATGSTMRVAALAVRAQSPRRVVVAVPVGAPETCQDIGREVDEAVCLRTPWQFYAISMWYEDFAQISDDEVRQLLDRAIAERSSQTA